MKKITTYSIEESVLIDFKRYANKNSLNASKFVENKLKNYINECMEKDNKDNELQKTL